MSDIVIPKNYKSQLNLYETQVAIKTVKDFFQGLLAERLHLLLHFQLALPIHIGRLQRKQTQSWWLSARIRSMPV